MYTYEQMLCDFSSLPIYSAGNSRFGRALLYTRFGTGEGGVFINGAHHGLESVTALLCVQFAKLLKTQRLNKKVVIMPMVNPDGVTIAQNRIPKGTKEHDFLSRLSGSDDFSKTWQANAAGVDLNHNYDAGWSPLAAPGPTRCSGRAPFSEPETRAVKELIEKENFDIVICLHSQGEVIYQGYNGKTPKGSEEIAKRMSEITRYSVEMATGISGAGGLKDWFVDKFNRPGFTIEVGTGKNPLPLCQARDISRKLFPALLLTCKL